MQILIITASLPYPAASGGALRALGILRGLHDNGHQITLLTYGDITFDWQSTPLADYCTHVEIIPTSHRPLIQRLREFLSGYADIEGRLYDEKFRDALITLMKHTSFDVIQFEGIEIACFIPEIRQQYPDSYICFDTFNAEAALQHNIYMIDRQQLKRLPMAFYSWVQSKRLRTYEGRLCRLSNTVIAVSEEDAVYLNAYRKNKDVVVVPSGIITDDYQSEMTQDGLPEQTIVFTGKMDYRPNVDAMLWFFEDIWHKINMGHLVIVGQKPHPRLQPLLQEDRITITGWVDSVQPYLRNATVYIAPLRMGSGTRLKILEALASGCAIVATTTAVTGLNDTVKQAIIIADDAQDFADAVKRLLNNPTERDALRTKAPEAVRESYDWSVLIPRLLDAYTGT